MKQYVIDANILFSGVLSRKAIYRAVFNQNLYYAPDFILAELNNYREVILRKTNVQRDELKEFTLFLFSKIIVVPDYVISEASYRQAQNLLADIDPKDVAYLALNEELGTILLTRDKPLYEGLIGKGYERVQLFGDFIAQNLTGEGI
ncbi:hypothetical protein BN8_03746 [Fibrisoma limi BUZ 3]|uniref:PIN domain-containing protein n=1 Tax=Fibrisoma limi BUZ 3 TaxID=1185876 RepID=I2GKY8_9BACT|nr:PIN domain-containing protein [Fibrisoma limi]CCH54564.1 hypothetical protein BN8_03746 [Fibrisoma limi BUZ 3]